MALPSSSTTTMAWSSNTVPSPAYNPVSARTSLARPPTAHAEAAPPATPQKAVWTPAVREYVRRAFDPDNAIAGISSGDMTLKLKSTIGFFAERGQLESLDWSAYPLPQEIIRDERASASAHFQHTTFPFPPNGQTNPALTTPTTKKRKSQDNSDLTSPANASIPPWRTTNLESRMTFPTPNGHNEKRQKKNALASDMSSKLDRLDLEKRKQRFQLGKPGASPGSDSDEMSLAICVGTNMNLEKQYFRLTAPPKPETVRPQHVLEHTLSMLRKKWKTDKNYGYTCNQFKSLRQDLTVQHIKNEFTVKVYESHARIALEQGDMGEYNQCQTQLKALFQQNLGGNPAEFKAYRILYFVYTCNKTDMNDLLAELTPADQGQPWIKHALDVRSALALGNYHKFFRLYLDAPNMGSYLMDMFIERERLHALANISRAYMNVALRFLTDELSFENDDVCRAFLESHGAQGAIEQKFDGHGGSQLRVKVKEAASAIEGLRQAAFARVDIKGQI